MYATCSHYSGQNAGYPSCPSCLDYGPIVQQQGWSPQMAAHRPYIPHSRLFTQASPSYMVAGYGHGPYGMYAHYSYAYAPQGLARPDGSSVGGTHQTAPSTHGTATTTSNSPQSHGGENRQAGKRTHDSEPQHAGTHHGHAAGNPYWSLPSSYGNFPANWHLYQNGGGARRSNMNHNDGSESWHARHGSGSSTRAIPPHQEGATNTRDVSSTRNSKRKPTKKPKRKAPNAEEYTPVIDYGDFEFSDTESEPSSSALDILSTDSSPPGPAYVSSTDCASDSQESETSSDGDPWDDSSVSFSRDGHLVLGEKFIVLDRRTAFAEAAEAGYDPELCMSGGMSTLEAGSKSSLSLRGGGGYSPSGSKSSSQNPVSTATTRRNDKKPAKAASPPSQDDFSESSGTFSSSSNQDCRLFHSRGWAYYAYTNIFMRPGVDGCGSIEVWPAFYRNTNGMHVANEPSRGGIRFDPHVDGVYHLSPQLCKSMEASRAALGIEDCSG